MLQPGDEYVGQQQRPQWEGGQDWGDNQHVGPLHREEAAPRWILWC